MRRSVAAAVLLLGGVLVGEMLAPGLMGGRPAPWDTWGPVFGVSGALLILSVGLIRESRRGS